MRPELTIAGVALAVCTILKDTILSLFPDTAARISVLSNQLGPLQHHIEQRNKDVQEKRTDLNILRQEGALGLFLASRTGHLGVPAPHLLDAWASPDFPRDDILEIFIVEDSDWDLGVARAIRENSQILRVARAFAEQVLNEEDPGGEGSYLRFGAPTESPYIYLKGASDVLAKLANVPVRSGASVAGATAS
jgi:hypothetical protein